MTQDKNNLTYRELLALFLERAPNFKDNIDDYRPAPGANSIQVWLKNKEEAIATYYPKNDSFIIRFTKQREDRY